MPVTDPPASAATQGTSPPVILISAVVAGGLLALLVSGAAASVVLAVLIARCVFVQLVLVLMKRCRRDEDVPEWVPKHDTKPSATRYPAHVLGRFAPSSSTDELTSIQHIPYGARLHGQRHGWRGRSGAVQAVPPAQPYRS